MFGLSSQPPSSSHPSRFPQTPDLTVALTLRSRPRGGDLPSHTSASSQHSCLLAPRLLGDPSPMVSHPSCTGVLLPLRSFTVTPSNRPRPPSAPPPQPAATNSPEVIPHISHPHPHRLVPGMGGKVDLQPGAGQTQTPLRGMLPWFKGSYGC